MARFNLFLLRSSFAALILLMLGGSALQAQFKGVGYKKKGFTDIVEAGVILPSNIYPVGFEAQNIFGVMLGPHWTVGGGVGINSYSSDLLAVGFLHGRYHFLKDSEYTPFMGLDAGYAYGFNNLPGGPTATPSVGMKYWLDTRVGIFGSLGYKMQMIPLNFTGTTAGTGQNDGFLTGFNFRIGMQF